MVEKDIPVDDIGLGKHCKCGRWHSWADYEVEQLCECGRRLVMVKQCVRCHTEIHGSLCDCQADRLRRDCRLAHLAIAAGACVGSGALLAEYDEAWEAKLAAWREEYGEHEEARSDRPE